MKDLYGQTLKDRPSEEEEDGELFEELDRLEKGRRARERSRAPFPRTLPTSSKPWVG